MAQPLTSAEKIIVPSGVALVAVSWFPWFGGGGPSHNGWANPLSGVGVLLSTFMLLQVSLARHPQVTLPSLRLPWNQVQGLLGGLSFFLVLLQILIGDGSRARTVAAAAGLAAAGGLAYGGFRAFRSG